MTRDPDNLGTETSGRSGRLAAADLTPKLQRGLLAISKSVNAQLPVAQLIARQFSEQHQQMFANLARVTQPKVDLPKIEVPALKLDFPSLFPDIERINGQILRQLEPTFATLRELQRTQFAHIFADLLKLAESNWPPNWKGVERPSKDLLDRILLDEGLCLAWVPPASILRRLLAAETPQARRKIVGTNWKRIAFAVREELGQVGAQRLRQHVKFAHKSVDALLEGAPEAAQALAANLLDSILRKEFTRSDRHAITSQKGRIDIEDYPRRLALVLGGIWGAYGEYWSDRGDQIPLRFSRNASAHAVSRRQYSRINATISLMHVTALLRVIQSDVLR